MTEAGERASVARGGPAQELLGQALAGVSLARRPGRRDRATAAVVVALSPPAPVAAAVLHALVDRLRDEGWTRVVVAGALTTLDRDRGYDDPVSLARDAGYLGRTPGGNRYDVVDLRAETTVADLPPGSVLAGRDVSRAWVHAGLRVVLARSVTDPVDGFAGCLSVLLGVVPPVAGAAPGDVACALLAHLPPDVAAVDALISSHGPAGNAVLEPLETGTVIAGNGALLVDLATAALQGIDPARSALCAAALRDRPDPPLDHIHGDLTPFAGWRAAPRPPAPVPAAISRLAQVLRAEADPREDVVVRGLRRVVTGEESVREPGLGSLSLLAGAATDQVRAWSTMFAKGRVDRVETSLGFAPGDHADADYDGVPAYLAPLERLLADTPTGADGLRWRYVEGAVVFEVSRTVEAPYASFVERVDIAAGISLMADYLGGRVVPISRDAQGRVRRQAERNLYLPQPNYLAFWGGAPIDVGKIELVEYGEDSQRLSWRTVVSPNGSAVYDDGSLTFDRAGPTQTTLTVRGRQLFTLPPFWQVVDLDRYPDVKDALVADAYRRFFAGTFDNLEACYEGREFRIGRPAADPEAPLPTTAVAATFGMAREWLTERPLRERLARPPRDRAPRGALDGDGFRHFTGATAAGPPAARPGPLARFAAEMRAAFAADAARLGGR